MRRQRRGRLVLGVAAWVGFAVAAWSLPIWQFLLAAACMYLLTSVAYSIGRDQGRSAP